MAMIRRMLRIAGAAVSSAAFLYAADAGDSARQFVRGSLQDKVSVVRSAPSGRAGAGIAERGLDFCLESAPVLPGDRDLAALATASVLALSRESAAGAEDAGRLCTKLAATFGAFDDENVRVAVIDRIVLFPEGNGTAVSLLDSYLRSARGAQAGAVVQHALTALGRVGGSSSLAIIYDAWRAGDWAQFRAEEESELVLLSARFPADAKRLIAEGDIESAAAYFDLLEKSGRIPDDFKAELAENALSRTITTMEDVPGTPAGSVRLQLAALRVIAEARWTRAAGLVGRYFALARQEYREHALSDAEFIAVVNDTAKLASSELAQSLSDCLADFNSSLEKGSGPVKSVVLAVISALGALGDKTAFDNLLYVTYLGYPEEVVGAARDALAKLKW